MFRCSRALGQLGCARLAQVRQGDKTMLRLFIHESVPRLRSHCHGQWALISRKRARLTAVVTVLSAVLVAPSFSPSACCQQPSKADRAEAIAVVAAAKSRVGELKVCNKLYLQAFRIDVSCPIYLYKAARCAHQGADLISAQDGYQAFLARAGTTHALRALAQQHLDSLAASRSKQSSAALGASTTQSKASIETRKPPRVNPLLPPVRATPLIQKVGRGALATGVVFLGVGLAVTWAGLSDREQLQADLESDPQSGLIDKITYAQAVQRLETVNNTSLVGFSILGLGIVAMVAGTVLMVLDDGEPNSHLSLFAADRGLVLRARF